MIQRPGLGRRAAVGALLGLALPALGGCGLEAKDFTSKEHSQIQAADFRLGGVRIRNAFLTTSTLNLPAVSGNSTKPPPPPNAYLVVTLVNAGPGADRLIAVSTTIGVATLSTGPLTLPPGQVVAVSDPDIDPSAPTIAISGKTPTEGTTVPVQFTFAKAGTTQSIAVPVVSPDGLSLSPTQAVPTIQATPPPEVAPSAGD